MSEQLECQRCGVKSPEVEKRRQNTAYHDEESNFATLCPACHEENDEYWADMWASYYAGCL